jgi:hypothetical protein
MTSLGVDAGTRVRWVSPRVKVALAVFALALVGLLGYGIGHNHSRAAHVLTGRAYVGTDEASITVDGYVYGVTISPNGMQWYDAAGARHQGGVPACLEQPGYTWLRFGYASATGPDGASWRAVTWVQCVTDPGAR